MLPPLLPVSMFATPSIVTLLEFGRWPLTVKPSAAVGATPVPADDPGHERREREERALAGGDVLERLTVQRERALAAGRLQLADAARHADFFGHLRRPPS